MDHPVSFDSCLYQYKVSFGVIESIRSIHWEYHIKFDNWGEAKEFIDLWHNQKEYPVITIQTAFEHRKFEEMKEGGWI